MWQVFGAPISSYIEKSHAGGLRTDPPLDAGGLQKLSHFETGLLVPVKVVVKKILTWALCRLFTLYF